MSSQISKILGREAAQEGGKSSGESSVPSVGAAAAPDAGAAPETGAKQAYARFQTHLGEGCVVEGRLVCKGPARLSGAVTGEVNGDSLIAVDDGAVINADITAAEATINGRVVGNVSAAGRVMLGASALVKGDIRTARISIAEGAQLSGRIDMTAGDAVAPGPAREPVKTLNWKASGPSARAKGPLRPAAAPDGGAAPTTRKPL